MKTYLNVPYAQKEIAKTHGARWDSARKQWFYDGASLPEGLVCFNNQKTETTQIPRTYYVNACGGLDCGKRGCDDCN